MARWPLFLAATLRIRVFFWRANRKLAEWKPVRSALPDNHEWRAHNESSLEVPKLLYALQKSRIGGSRLSLFISNRGWESGLGFFGFWAWDRDWSSSQEFCVSGQGVPGIQKYIFFINGLRNGRRTSDPKSWL